jgi:hypothetical protein
MKMDKHYDAPAHGYRSAVLETTIQMMTSNIRTARTLGLSAKAMRTRSPEESLLGVRTTTSS